MIDIIYRCCGKEVYPEQKRSSRPEWFDKLRCYKSVWDMTQNDPSTFSMHVIYDGERSPLLDYIEGMRVSDCAIYKVNKGGYESIQDQYDLADKLTGDWIYFCEDDYIHSPDAARVMLEGANRFELISWGFAIASPRPRSRFVFRCAVIHLLVIVSICWRHGG